MGLGNKVKHWDIGMSGEVEKRFVRNTMVTVQIKWSSFFRKIKDEKNTVSLAHPSYCGGLAAHGR